jgi:hypothetical protein
MQPRAQALGRFSVVSWEEPGPFGMVGMQDGNGVVRWPVLEHNYKAAIAKPFWALLVSDLAVQK